MLHKTWQIYSPASVGPHCPEQHNHSAELKWEPLNLGGRKATWGVGAPVRDRGACGKVPMEFQDPKVQSQCEQGPCLQTPPACLGPHVPQGIPAPQGSQQDPGLGTCCSGTWEQRGAPDSTLSEHPSLLRSLRLGLASLCGPSCPMCPQDCFITGDENSHNSGVPTASSEPGAVLGFKCIVPFHADNSPAGQVLPLQSRGHAASNPQSWESHTLTFSLQPLRSRGPSTHLTPRLGRLPFLVS